MGSAAQAQFAGKITYLEKINAKVPGVSDSLLQKNYGNIRTFIIQGGEFKNSYSGVRRSVVIYKSVDHTIYRFSSVADTVGYLDANLNPLEIINLPIIEESNEFILGLKCKTIKIESAFETFIYFFNEKYRIDPSEFQFHRFDGWDVYVRLAHSIPLKIIYENKKLRLISTAIEIQDAVFSEEEFSIPKRPLKPIFD